MGRRTARLIVVLLVSVFFARDACAEKLRVVVPKDQNLQYMSFWVALASGAFAAEGLDIELVSPKAPSQGATMFIESDAAAAVLPPPMFLPLIAKRAPIVLVANLLTNEAINIVVSRKIAMERKLDPAAPLKTRLEGLKGLRVGIAPHPPSRLRALFTSEGLDAERDLKLVTLHGKEQNAAFHDGEVDALFAHTPYVERAIVHDDAFLLVHLSRGESPVLANRLIHAFVFKKQLFTERHDLAVRAYRALARADAAIHASKAETRAMLHKQMPDRDEKEIATIVDLYEPAIPLTPAIRTDDLPPALALLPSDHPKVDLGGIPLADYVATDLSVEAERTPFARARILVIAVALATLIAAVVLVARARRSRSSVSS